MRTVQLLLADSLRPDLEDRLPAWVDPYWLQESGPVLTPTVTAAEAAWLDGLSAPVLRNVIDAATGLTWLNTQSVGLERFPVEALSKRGVQLSNGRGLNAGAIAEFVLMGMLAIVKGYRDIVRAQIDHRWLSDSPGFSSLTGKNALILGHGSIGQAVGRILKAFDVNVSHVRQSPHEEPGVLGPTQWRDQLRLFDWVILALPSTAATRGILGASEFAAMKQGVFIVNVGRGDLIDQDALVDSLQSRWVGGAMLDVTTPEPLPSDHILWQLPQVHITMHLSGKSEIGMRDKAIRLFLDNLARFARGEALLNLVDLSRGY